MIFNKQNDQRILENVRSVVNKCIQPLLNIALTGAASFYLPRPRNQHIRWVFP